jgi:hypothetical protein
MGSCLSTCGIYSISFFLLAKGYSPNPKRREWGVLMECNYAEAVSLSNALSHNRKGLRTRGRSGHVLIHDMHI